MSKRLNTLKAALQQRFSLKFKRNRCPRKKPLNLSLRRSEPLEQEITSWSMWHVLQECSSSLVRQMWPKDEPSHKKIKRLCRLCFYRTNSLALQVHVWQNVCVHVCDSSLCVLKSLEKFLMSGVKTRKRCYCRNLLIVIINSSIHIYIRIQFSSCTFPTVSVSSGSIVDRMCCYKTDAFNVLFKLNLFISCSRVIKSKQATSQWNVHLWQRAGQRSETGDRQGNVLQCEQTKEGKYSTSSEFKTQVMQENPQMAF